MYGYIYITENLENGRLYVGMKRSPVFRPDYLGSGKLIKNAIKKYGKDRFIVKLLEVADDETDLRALEIATIAAMDAVYSKRYYNIASGGQSYNGSENRSWSSDRKAAFSEYMQKEVAAGRRSVPVGNRGNKSFRHTDRAKSINSDAKKLDHARAQERNRPYHSEQGLEILRSTMLRLMTPEFIERRNSSPAYQNMMQAKRDSADNRYQNLPEMLKTMTQSEIALALGVDQSAVAQRIREHDVVVERDPAYFDNVQAKREAAAKLAQEARRKQGEKTWEGFDLAEMYKSMTQAQIALKIGVSQVRVSQRMKQLGITKPVAGS